MAIGSIGYVEVYASDGRAAIDYFVSSFGFAHVADAVSRDARSRLLRQGDIHLIVTTGSRTESFLAAHGDGVADIAFTCDDVSAVAGRAATAGARLISDAPGGPAVAGFGDTRHTLVAQSAAQLGPPGWSWVYVRPSARPDTGRIRSLDHVAVCVESGTLEQWTDFYSEALGITRYSDEYIEIGDQAMASIVVRSPSGGITFTILEQDLTKKAGQVEAFLSRNGGAGVQHLAFGVDDIIGAVREYSARGIDFLPTPGAYYDMLAERLGGLHDEIGDLRDTNVLADRDEWGYLLQLFSRSPYRRNTMFYELIQRRGARGFGSANIRALYEAVERDGLAS